MVIPGDGYNLARAALALHALGSPLVLFQFDMVITVRVRVSVQITRAEAGMG